MKILIDRRLAAATVLDQALAKGFIFHFLSSVYSTEVFNDVDVWGFYPSSDSKNIQDEVLARGNERQLIYESDTDREHFLALVEVSAARFDVAVHGFVLMANHFHLLPQTRRANLSRWHWLMVASSVYFNRRHRRCGHLLQPLQEFGDGRGRVAA